MSNSRNLIKGLKLKQKDGAVDYYAIIAAIEESILNKRRPLKDWTQKTTFAPSSLAYGSGACSRRWHLSFSGVEEFLEDADAMALANMSLGSLLHDEIQTALGDAAILESEELEITIEDPPIRGFVDAIVNWNGKRLVCEIKTTKQESFVYRETSGKPLFYHLLQLLIYLYATDIDEGFLLYVNRNEQTMIPIPVKMDDANKKILEDVFEWLRTVRSTWEGGQLANIPFRRSKETDFPSNTICRTCPVRNECFKRKDEGDVDIPTMELPTL